MVFYCAKIILISIHHINNKEKVSFEAKKEAWNDLNYTKGI